MEKISGTQSEAMRPEIISTNGGVEETKFWHCEMFGMCNCSLFHQSI
jgi:hypothetical protein